MVAKTLGILAVATLVVLAGCTGYSPGEANSPSAEGTMTDGGVEATAGSGGGATTSGVVQFYVSDEKNAIGDFEHLNVTISKVGFQRADGEDEEEETETVEETVENDTETVTETDVTTTENATPTASPTVTDEADDEEEMEEREDGEAGGWTEYEVENRTVDLTRLQGENATLLSSFDVPEGSYTKVFVHVSEINGTLENGENVNVKLPSEKLQLTKGFTVEANESVDFVFDITVFKAGNSGKYILKPVVSESGTGVPIEDVDDEREEERGDERDDDERDDDERDDEEREEMDREAEDGLNASFVGPVEPGANATVRVTANGSAVANATVYLDDSAVGMTDDAGELTFRVPADTKEIEVTIESGDVETELEAEFESEADEGDEEDAGDDEENAEDDDGGTDQDE